MDLNERMIQTRGDLKKKTGLNDYTPENKHGYPKNSHIWSRRYTLKTHEFLVSIPENFGGGVGGRTYWGYFAAQLWNYKQRRLFSAIFSSQAPCWQPMESINFAKASSSFSEQKGSGSLQYADASGFCFFSCMWYV